MPTQKPTIRYVGSDIRWAEHFKKFIADLAYLCFREDQRCHMVLIDGEVLTLEGVYEEAMLSSYHGVMTIVVVPRGVPSKWRDRLDGVQFVTGKRNLQLLRPQMERIIGELND